MHGNLNIAEIAMIVDNIVKAYKKAGYFDVMRKSVLYKFQTSKTGANVTTVLIEHIETLSIT